MGLTGTTGAQGPAGAGADAWINQVVAALPLATTELTMASLTLPAGSYLLHAKASLLRTNGNGSSACTLYNGLTVLDQLMNQGSTSGELTVLQSSVTLAANTAIIMRCVMSTGTADVSRRTLTAYRVSTLTVQ